MIIVLLIIGHIFLLFISSKFWLGAFEFWVFLSFFKERALFQQAIK